MLKAVVTLTAVTLVSAISLAKPLAKMEIVCVGVENTNIVRTVYLSTDKTVYLADPLTQLLIVDSIQQPATDTIVLNAEAEHGSEVLTVKSSGEAGLTIQNSSANSQLTMNCYGKKTSGSEGTLHALFQ